MMDGSVYESAPVEAPKRNCIAVLVDNEPGVLARVIGLFSGRGYNIESLTVDEIDTNAHLSRITIVTNGPPPMIAQIEAQLSRLVVVRQVINLTTQGKSVEGCLAYIKFIGDANKREDAKMIARKLGARIVDTTGNAVIFELTAMFGHVDQMIAELKPLGEIEIARTGSVAMSCGETVLDAPDLHAVKKSA